jgi:hypothetical protein
VYQPGPSARNGRGGRPNPFGPNANVYNTAISGVKRPRDDVNNRDDRSQRARTDGPPVNAPTGPRNPQPTDGMPAMAPPRRNLADRVGPPPGAIPVMSPMGPAFLNPQTGQYMPADMGQQQNQRGNRRNGRDQQQQQSQQQSMMFAPGSVPIFIPPGMMPQFPQGGMFPPQVFAQMQAQQAGAGGAFPAFGAPMMQPQQPQAPPQAVPTKPSDDGLCKYGTECKNAYCKFAHPSPAATKESGLVLSAEACENQLECKDPVRGVLFSRWDGTDAQGRTAPRATFRRKPATRPTPGRAHTTRRRASRGRWLNRNHLEPLRRVANLARCVLQNVFQRVSDRVSVWICVHAPRLHVYAPVGQAYRALPIRRRLHTT